MLIGTVCRSIAPAALAACLLCGCGGEEGYNLSGNVTFAGKPIPEGKIYFTPDGTKGNSGAPGYANIKNGVFDTALDGGKPVAGGATVVGIEGIDPNDTGAPVAGDTSGETLVKSLFPYYETTADLPKADSTMDFLVPADAVNRKGGSAKPMIVP